MTCNRAEVKLLLRLALSYVICSGVNTIVSLGQDAERCFFALFSLPGPCFSEGAKACWRFINLFIQNARKHVRPF